MIDPRSALRATCGRWLRVRANVRALATSLAAAEYALRRDARRADADRELGTLAAQLATERQALDALGRDLDTRIAAVGRDCAAIEAGYVESLVAAARRRGS